jgi:hypothetical protein
MDPDLVAVADKLIADGASMPAFARLVTKTGNVELICQTLAYSAQRLADLSARTEPLAPESPGKEWRLFAANIGPDWDIFDANIGSCAEPPADAPGAIDAPAGSSAPPVDVPGAIDAQAGSSAPPVDVPGAIDAQAGSSAHPVDVPGAIDAQAGSAAPPVDAPGAIDAQAGSADPPVDVPGAIDAQAGSAAPPVDAPGAIDAQAGSADPPADAPGACDAQDPDEAEIPKPPLGSSRKRVVADMVKHLERPTKVQRTFERFYRRFGDSLVSRAQLGEFLRGHPDLLHKSSANKLFRPPKGFDVGLFVREGNAVKLDSEWLWAFARVKRL